MPRIKILCIFVFSYVFLDSAPNVIIIQTDEHNLRTLGCYREQMSLDQAFIWGKNVFVETPHIDSLAKDGLICTNYFAASRSVPHLVLLGFPAFILKRRAR